MVVNSYVQSHDQWLIANRTHISYLPLHRTYAHDYILYCTSESIIKKMSTATK